MAKSEIFRNLQRAFRSPETLGERFFETLSRPIDRRSFLKGSLSASTLVAATLAPASTRLLAGMLPVRNSGKVVVIGAGIAGLTAAYQLRKLGYACTVFEASHRVGGRMLTQDRFHQGMFCEMGGELIDRNHLSILRLAQELGVELEAFPAEEKDVETTLFFVEGRVYTESDLSRAVAPIVEQIRCDREEIFGNVDGEVLDSRNAVKYPNAVAFDRMTLAEYLDSLEGVEEWVKRLIGRAYVTEFGLDLDQQSALNLHMLVDYDLSDGEFELFGSSDEALRIRGGNSRLIERLTQVVEKGVGGIRYGHRLLAMKENGTKVSLAFQAPNGATIDVQADRVVCAIPFSLLRSVDLRSPMAPSMARAIRRTSYGTHTKAMMGTHDRFWRKRHSGLPHSNGMWVNDLRTQAYWETSRGQSGSGGVITCFRGGSAAMLNLEWTSPRTNETIVGGFLAPYSATTRARYQDTMLEARTQVNWAKEPFAQGSYFCPRPGDYTEILAAADATEWSGKLVFAGEHTTTNFGYMDSAVESAFRAVDQLKPRQA